MRTVRRVLPLRTFTVSPSMVETMRATISRARFGLPRGLGSPPPAAWSRGKAASLLAGRRPAAGKASEIVGSSTAG